MDFLAVQSSQALFAGQFKIIKKTQTVLKADLGSNIAITLWDTSNLIGGLYHILLPEPSNELDPWKTPLLYASIGLPEFLKQFLNKGGDLSSTTACVCGGSLTGFLNSKDLKWDIGGKNAQIVHNFLNKHNIPIIENETGGFHTRTLSIDLWEGKSLIQPFLQDHLDPSFGNAQIPPLEPNFIEEHVQTIKPIPQVALKAIRILNNPEFEIKELQDEISKDQTLSAKILAVVNSSHFGLNHKIDTINRAIVQLGKSNLINIILSTICDQYLESSSKGYSLCKGGLYQHSFTTALIARNIAKFSQCDVSPDLAFTCGLLHDIGKVVLDQFVNDHRSYFYFHITECNYDICELEKSKFGLDHVQAGELLAKRFDFPDNITECIRDHHHPISGESSKLCFIIALSDELSNSLQPHLTIEKPKSPFMEPFLKEVEISPSQLEKALDNIAWQELI